MFSEQPSIFLAAMKRLIRDVLYSDSFGEMFPSESEMKNLESAWDRVISKSRFCSVERCGFICWQTS